MAKGKTNTPSVRLLQDVDSVQRFYLNGYVQVGTIINAPGKTGDSQFLVMSDRQGDVTDIIRLNAPGQQIAPDKATVILSRNHDSSMNVASGYYADGMKCELSPSTHDTTDDIFYSRQYFAGLHGVSGYEKQRVWEEALSVLNDEMKSDDMKLEVIKHLNNAMHAYVQHRTEYERNDFHSQYDQIWYLHNTVNDIFAGTGAGDFSNDIKKSANDIHINNAQDLIQKLHSTAQNKTKTIFERTVAMDAVSEVQMRARYFEAAETFRAVYADNASKELLDAIGKDDQASLQIIRKELDTVKINLMASAGFDGLDRPDTEQQEDQKRRVALLYELTACHPTNARNGLSATFNAEIADSLATIRDTQGNPVIDLSKHYSVNDIDAMLKTLRNNPGRYVDQDGNNADSQVESALFAQRGRLTLKMMPNPEFFGADRAYSGLPNSDIDPLRYANRTYGGMTQHDFAAYLTDKTAAIRVVSENQQAIRNLYQENKDTLTEDQRMQAVVQFVKQHAGISDTTGQFSYLESDEFRRVVKDPACIFAAVDGKASITDTVYLTYEGGRLATTDAPTRRPEFAIQISNKDIRSEERCRELLKQLDQQLQFSKAIYDRPSQELLTVKAFLQDHLEYNRLVDTAQYNAVIANGIENDRVRYSDTTRALLADHAGHNLTGLINESETLSKGLDFASAPTAERIGNNYAVLSQYIEENKVSEPALLELQQSLRHDITNGVSIMRGFDGAMRDENGAVIVGREEDTADLRAAEMLDVATAIKTAQEGREDRLSKEEQLNIVNDVLLAQEERNFIVHYMKLSVFVEGAVDDSVRRDILANVHDLPQEVFDPNSGMSDRERAVAICNAFQLNIEASDDLLSTDVAIVNSSEIMNEVKRLRDSVERDGRLSENAHYYFSLEETKNIDELRELYQAAAHRDDLDLSLLGDTRYMQYAKTAFGNDSQEAELIDNILQRDGYHKVVTAARNIEELCARGNLTVEERDNLTAITNDLATVLALQDAGNHHYYGEAMVSASMAGYRGILVDAMNPNERSAYMQNLIDSDHSYLKNEAESLKNSLDRVFSSTDKPFENYGAIKVVEVFASDSGLNQLKGQLVCQMKNNPNYEDYRALNEHGDRLQRINELEKRVEQCDRAIEFNTYILENDKTSKQGRIRLENYITTQELRKEDAQKELEQLKSELRNTMGTTPPELKSAIEQYTANPSFETASQFAIHIRDAEGRTVLEPGEHSKMEICQALDGCRVPLSEREAVYSLRTNLTQEIMDEDKAAIVALCRARIDDIRTDVWLGTHNNIDVSSVDVTFSKADPKAIGIVTATVQEGDITHTGNVVFADESSFAIKTGDRILRVTGIQDAEEFMKQRGVAERDYQAIEAFEHTDMTHDAIRTMRTYEEAKLQNAGEESSQVSLEEQQKAQFMISKYDRAIERIDALQEILDLAEQGNIPSVALQSASLGDQDIVDLSEQYMRAKAMNDNATKDLNDIVQFNASREAYATVSQIEEKLERFSVAERDELARDFKHSFGVFSKEDFASDLKDLAMRDNISEEVRNLLSQYDSSNNLKDYIATVSPDNIHAEDIISSGQASEALAQASQFNALVEAVISDDKLHAELHEAIDQLRTSCPEEVCRAVEADLTSKIDESRIQTLAEVLETVYAESEHPAQILDDVIESKNESPAPIPDNVIEPEEDPVGFNLEMIPSIDSHFMDLFSSSDKDKITRGEIAREDHQNVSEEEYRKSAFEVQKYGFEPIVDALTVICEDNLHGGAKDYAKTFLSTYMQECVFQLNLDELGKWTEALKGSQMDDTVKAELLNHCKDVAETKQSGMDHSKSEGKDIEDNANKDNDKTHDADAKADDGLDF